MNKHQFKSSRNMYRSMMKALESSWGAQQELRAMQPLMYQCEPAGDLPVSVKVWCHKILTGLN